LSSFGQDPRLRLATIFADEQIRKTREAPGIFFLATTEARIFFLATTEARTLCLLFEFLHRRYKMNANAIKINTYIFPVSLYSFYLHEACLFIRFFAVKGVP